ncbi:hypothetical protein GCM10027456_68000 [Kineosporia babensis]
MEQRTALLIGVPAYDDQDRFSSLDEPVRADLGLMTRVLREGEYQVEPFGLGDEQPTAGRIQRKIRQALEQAPENGVLLIYFSGHGVVIDGRGYLVPQDAYAGPNGPYPDDLVPVVPRDLRACRARLVLIVADACRSQPLTEPMVVNEGLPSPPKGSLVVINSCLVGESARFSPEGSHFTKAFAETLDRRHSARTLDAVFRAVETQMARTYRGDGAQRQTPVRAIASNVPGPPEEILICEGDKVGDAWRNAASNTDLWKRTALPAPAVEEIKRAVQATVGSCAERWSRSQERFKLRSGMKDEWSDQNYPVRVLGALEACLPQTALLSGLELAAVISAPFIREVTLGNGLVDAGEISPDDFTRRYDEGARHDLELTHGLHEHVRRRAEGLAKRDHLVARDALALWLVHRWLAERPAPAKDATVQALCKDLVTKVSATAPGAVSGHETALMFQVLSQCVDADPTDSPLLEKVRSTAFDSRFRALAGFLVLSGAMAADPRRMPSVVVDHIGISSEVSVPTVQAALRQTRWTRQDNTITLNAPGCDHAAIYAALTEVFKRVRSTTTVFAGLEPDPGLTESRPQELRSMLRPAVDADGQPMFDKSLPRFRISDDKIRELLMGRQLYGDPKLALRELYQNALDACRYRNVRREYCDRTGNRVAPWEGTIVFRQDRDETGRAYIECEDNGVGMSEDVLRYTFASAGDRFVHRAQFRMEQAKWSALKPPLRLIPNSQFGVGVFSYFMIAEEIEIWTRPVDPDGDPEGPEVKAQIASSGSLFQISKADRKRLPMGGTIIRLYLNLDEELFAARSLREFLWVSEFRVEAQEGNTKDIWVPGELHTLPGVSSQRQYKDDLWWVDGVGALLADGIRTNEERYGLVVNLRDKHVPQFSVDRNTLQAWDQAWVDQQIDDSLPTVLDWGRLTLSWLWQVSESMPVVAEKIYQGLAQAEKTFPVEPPWGNARPAPALRVGCLPLDEYILDGRTGPSFDASDQWLPTWRAAVWSGLSSALTGRGLAMAAETDGFAVPGPIDGVLLTRLWDAALTGRGTVRVGRPHALELVDVLVDEVETPVQLLRRLRRYAVVGLDLSSARELPPVRHHRFVDRDTDLPEQTENAALLPAVLAWSPPGQERRTALAGHLAKVSRNLQASLGEVVKRSRELVPVGWISPLEGAGTELLERVCDDADVKALTGLYRSHELTMSLAVRPIQVLRLAVDLSCTVGEVLERYDLFAPLGFRVVGREKYPPDMSDIERAALEFVENAGDQLTQLHIYLLAVRLKHTVDEIVDGLERLRSMGFLNLPEPSQLDGPELTPDENDLIADHLVTTDYHRDQAEVVTGWQGLSRVLRRIGSCHKPDFERQLGRYGRLATILAEQHVVSAAEVVDTSSMFDCSVAEAFETLTKVLPATCIPDLPEAVRSSTLHGRDLDLDVLTDEPHYGQPRLPGLSWSLNPMRLADTALYHRLSIAEYLERLEPGRALGAHLPELDQAQQAMLTDRPADRHDAEILQQVDQFGIESTLGEVTALHLVQIAGRYGWTLSQAHQRLARFTPFGVELQYPAQACDDQIVFWQDLLVITEYLDGQAPVLSGNVSRSHLARCVEEVGDPVQTVISRLRRFAPLFGYQIDLLEESDD